MSTPQRIWYTASREPTDTAPGSQLSRIRTQRRSVYNIVLSELRASLPAQSTPLGESLGRCNQSVSRTSRACYGHPRCNVNLVRLFCFSLPFPVFGRLFFFLHPRGHEPTAYSSPLSILCYTIPQDQVRRCSSPPWC